MANALGDDARFAGTGAGDDEQRALAVFPEYRFRMGAPKANGFARA
jgi:hypothetical protein